MKILITGARGGMGKDAAIALAKNGHEVTATTRTEEQANQLREEFSQSGLSINVAKINILEEADRIRAAEFKPDVLINNAAIGESGPIIEIPMERLRANFETNVFATVDLTQRIAKQMIDQQLGRIIIFSSVGGRITLPYLGAYNMTKYALESFADALRQELRSEHIHVSLIEPGAIATGFNERMNASKYTWFNNENRFSHKHEEITAYEQMLTRDQASTAGNVRSVLHAVESKSPRARYIRPRSIALLVWLSAIFPTSFTDWMIRSRK